MRNSLGKNDVLLNDDMILSEEMSRDEQEEKVGDMMCIKCPTEAMLTLKNNKIIKADFSDPSSTLSPSTDVRFLSRRSILVSQCLSERLDSNQLLSSQSNNFEKNFDLRKSKKGKHLAITRSKTLCDSVKNFIGLEALDIKKKALNVASCREIPPTEHSILVNDCSTKSRKGFTFSKQKLQIKARNNCSYVSRRLLRKATFEIPYKV